MNDFFVMVVHLAKLLKDHPTVLMIVISIVCAFFLILEGKLQGVITFGG